MTTAPTLTPALQRLAVTVAGRRLILDHRPVLVLAVIAVLASSASTDEGPVLCPFRRCTGGYCPGCGMTRSAGSLIRGGVGQSWHHHPFILIALAQAVALCCAWFAPGGRLQTLLAGRRDVLLALNAAVVATIWVVRLASGAIPIPFG